MESMSVEPLRLGHPSVARFHAAQEVGSSTSRVHPVSWGTDPLLGVVSSSDPVEVPEPLARWAAVLDAAYGYQTHPQHPRGHARRAPSAGALYPTELFVVEPTAVHQYEFWDRRFHHGRACDASAAARALGLGADDLALVAVSVFWRTVQRYGVRGYRYCMLDAAHVVSNLMAVLGVHGGGGLALAAPSMRVSRALALPRSCGAVRALIVRGASRLAGDDLLVPAWTSTPRTIANEHSPLLSPLLQRVSRFHLESLADMAQPLPVASVAMSGATVAERRSARSFTRAALPRTTYDVIRELLATRRSVLPVGDDALRSFAVRVRVDGMRPGFEWIDQRGDTGELACDDATADRLAARVRALCQDQILAGEAAYAVIIGIRGDVLQGVSPAGYRDLVSEVGHLGAELGSQAAKLGIATTTIGGFSDDAARRLVGDNSWFPIAIQLYGERGHHGYKLDAASRVLENKRA